jgi:hypothetical protein
MSRTGFLRQGTRASNLATSKRQDPDAALHRLAEAVLADVVRADAERGQAIRDAVAKTEACEVAP